MAYPKPGFVGLDGFGMAEVAGDAFLKLGVRPIRRRQRFAAGKTHLVMSRRQAGADRQAAGVTAAQACVQARLVRDQQYPQTEGCHGNGMENDKQALSACQGNLAKFDSVKFFL